MYSKRTFIAIKVEPEKPLSELFGKLKSELREDKIKWVDEDNLHLTLRFLGETSQAQFNQLDSVLKRLAKENKPFSFELHGAGFFGSKMLPKVLFVSVSKTERLDELADSLIKSITGFGFQEDVKPFAPHLTLGRIKSIQDTGRFHQLVLSYKNAYFQQVTVNEIVFYESILQPAGPVYKPMRIYKLNNVL